MMPFIPSASSCSSISFICILSCQSIERTTDHQGSTIFCLMIPPWVGMKFVLSSIRSSALPVLVAGNSWLGDVG